MITKEEYVEWLNHPTTKEIEKILKNKMQESRVELSRRIKGHDNETLKYMAGFVDGIESVCTFKELFDFPRTEREEDEDD
jgi:hypothetical protein